VSDIERLRAKFEETLRQTPLLDPRVEVFEGDFHEILVRILSSSFDLMDENERQVTVWKRMFADFDSRDRKLVKFIFTDSPTEFEEAFGKERLAEFGAVNPVH
jgi:hypothetical protein